MSATTEILSCPVCGKADYNEPLAQHIAKHMQLIGTREPTPNEVKYGLGLEALARECLARPHQGPKQVGSK